MKFSPRTQALIDSFLKANSKKSSFSPPEVKAIQRDKTQNIAQNNPIRCPNCYTIIT